MVRVGHLQSEVVDFFAARGLGFGAFFVSSSVAAAISSPGMWADSVTVGVALSGELSSVACGVEAAERFLWTQNEAPYSIASISLKARYMK